MTDPPETHRQRLEPLHKPKSFSPFTIGAPLPRSNCFIVLIFFSGTWRILCRPGDVSADPLHPHSDNMTVVPGLGRWRQVDC